VKGAIGMRRYLTLLGIALGTATVTVWAAPLGQSVLAAEPLIDQLLSRSLLSEQTRLWLSIPYWLAGGGLAVGALAAIIWLDVHRQQRRWQRVNFARQQAQAFQAQPGVKNVLDILDYEEFRTFYAQHPKTGETLCFEAHDDRLKRALRSHAQMVKTRRGLDDIERLAQTADNIDEQTLAIVRQYDDEEFVIELILRGWFDNFLVGLENFEDLISSGLVTAEELKPFIIYWIQIIGDRRYRRTGGSGFYDQLFDYIYWSGYGGVQALFERYGFKLLPPPYSTQDFTDMEQEAKYDTFRALDLAKAAQLVYEDREYVSDIVRLWLSDDIDNRWEKMSDREYVVCVIKRWLREGETWSERDILKNFKYLDMRITDTQAFLFRDGNNIVLVFRGSQQLADWKTNFKIRLRPFSILADKTAIAPKGRVHRGFLAAWQSIEKQVVYYLKKWQTPDTRLWITGHSLGGALAAMAAISLDAQGFTISGLYTFGQPRIADWQLVKYMNDRLKDRIFRYANNNDVVPLIPPQITPWMPTRVYGHMGQFRYFNRRGNMRQRSWFSQQWLDRLLGLLDSLVMAGTPDAIDDHKMEFYIANLQKALVKEAEQAKLEREQQIIEGEFTGEEADWPMRRRLRRWRK
jgi:hypothetical protein